MFPVMAHDDEDIRIGKIDDCKFTVYHITLRIVDTVLKNYLESYYTPYHSHQPNYRHILTYLYGSRFSMTRARQAKDDNELLARSTPIVSAPYVAYRASLFLIICITIRKINLKLCHLLLVRQLPMRQDIPCAASD